MYIKSHRLLFETLQNCFTPLRLLTNCYWKIFFFAFDTDITIEYLLRLVSRLGLYVSRTSLINPCGSSSRVLAIRSFNADLTILFFIIIGVKYADLVDFFADFYRHNYVWFWINCTEYLILLGFSLFKLFSLIEDNKRKVYEKERKIISLYILFVTFSLPESIISYKFRSQEDLTWSPALMRSLSCVECLRSPSGRTSRCGSAYTCHCPWNCQTSASCPQPYSL